MNKATQDDDSATRHHLREVGALFLRLGLTAFGGPAAHIAMMHDEVVKRKQWLSDQEFLDLVGATHLIPGPNSTELAIHLGFQRAGWRGLILAGASFILPAMLIVMALAWGYVEYGTTPAADALLYGVKPVVIAIIIQALWGFGRKAVKNSVTAIVGIAALVLYFLSVNEIALLFLAGAAVMLVKNVRRLREIRISLMLPFGGIAAGIFFPAFQAVPFSLPLLFWTFLKIGAVLYGSGYVLLAFLQGDFVKTYGWLTEQQLLDAVAIGQVTPGPVFTTATFIGYILDGVPGALLATLAIFLPSFIFVALTRPFLPRLRASPWFSGLLDGVNVASVALMAGVTVQLGRASLIDLPTILIALVSFVLLLRYQVNSTWLIAGGAVAGLIHAARLF